MMKKLTKLFVLLFSVTALAFTITACGGGSNPKPTPTPSVSPTPSVDWDSVFTVNATGETITGLTAYGNTLSKIEIPAAINGTAVTSIGGEAFESCDSLTEIVIPDSVTSIGRSAFYSCVSLTEIVIPDSVTSIGYDAFEYCYSLTIYCEAASKPSGWSSGWNIGDGGVTIPVVWNCKNNEVATDGAIYKIIDGIRYALKDGVATVVEQPQNIAGSITIPASVTYNGSTYAVTSIGSEAFYSCDSLTEIVIPDSVTNIGEGAFYLCDSLTIYCEVASKPWVWDSDWNYSDCPEVWNCKNNEVATDGAIYKIIDGIRYALEDGVATVVRQPRNVSGSIIIPASVAYNGTTYSVTSIGAWAFEYCESLTTVTFGDNSQLTSIGDSAFRYCESLTEIVIPDSVTSIDFQAFQYCDSLTTVTFGEDSQLTSIGKCAFEDCDSLTEIVIPDSVTRIGEDAFYHCDSLTTVTFGDNSQLTSIGWGAFQYCDSLTEIVIPEGVTSIGEYAFSSCYSLTEIVIPDSVTSIGEIAFFNCYFLTTVTFGDNSQLTSIGSYAFCDCDSLRKIVIPNSVTSIGDYAFQLCDSLAIIYCEVASQPDGWDSDWNRKNNESILEFSVVWGYKGS